MKKILALLLALFLFIATFTGCADENPGKEDPNTPQSGDNGSSQLPEKESHKASMGFEYTENED